MDGRHGVYGGREAEETTGEDWRLRGRARAGHPYRPAVWLNALHREAVSFDGHYVSFDPSGEPSGMVRRNCTRERSSALVRLTASMSAFTSA